MSREGGPEILNMVSHDALEVWGLLRSYLEVEILLFKVLDPS